MTVHTVFLLIICVGLKADEAVSTGASVIAAACPFCNTMLTDGIKNKEKENEIQVMDVAELIAASME